MAFKYTTKPTKLVLIFSVRNKKVKCLGLQVLRALKIIKGNLKTDVLLEFPQRKKKNIGNVIRKSRIRSLFIYPGHYFALVKQTHKQGKKWPLTLFSCSS